MPEKHRQTGWAIIAVTALLVAVIFIIAYIAHLRYDVAPSYGNSEERLGPALRPYRDEVFLACKTGQRDKKGARKELEQSLKRLKADHLDLYQLHGVYDVKEDVERALGPGGAIEAFLAAREKGLIRFIGFSTHSVSAALRAIEEFPFDTVLCPINYVCHYTGKFDQKIVEAARNKNMGILAIKALAQTLRPDFAVTSYRQASELPLLSSAPHPRSNGHAGQGRLLLGRGTP